ncbi:MAG: YafY family protein [Sediminibacterium sp.]
MESIYLSAYDIFTMNRIDRLFGILTLLQSKKYVTAEKIADKFNMSIRTVYRDIKALGESGIPVSFEPQKGYFVVQGYFLPPVSFSSEEANAFLLTETIVYGFADRSIQTHYSSALNKIKAVLRSAQKEKLELLSDHIRLQLPARMAHNFEYLAMLQQAIAARTIVQLDYKNNNEETSNRDIEPIGLVFYAFSWHLIAWCHKRNGYRDFKASRILHIKNTDRAFKKKDHMALNDYMKELPVNY